MTKDRSLDCCHGSPTLQLVSEIFSGFSFLFLYKCFILFNTQSIHRSWAIFGDSSSCVTYVYCKKLLFEIMALPIDLGPVHTNPFSNENGAVLLRIRLSSTLQRRKRSPKTEPFENALQSAAIWKRCFLKTLFSRVVRENDAIWKRWRHKIDTTGRQATRPWVSKMADRGYHVASISRQFRGPIYWNAHASSSFEHAHWGYKSVFKTDTAL